MKGNQSYLNLASSRAAGREKERDAGVRRGCVSGAGFKVIQGKAPADTAVRNGIESCVYKEEIFLVIRASGCLLNQSASRLNKRVYTDRLQGVLPRLWLDWL